MYIWMKQGKPWKESDDAAGNVVTKLYHAAGVYVEYWYNVIGGIHSERWYKNDMRHREGGKPAIVWYNDDGSIDSEDWFKNGQLHRDGDKPAAVNYSDDGSVYSEQWFKDGNEYDPV